MLGLKPKKKAPPPIPFGEMTRAYKMLNGLRDRAKWGNSFQALDAVDAVRKSWQATDSWIELDYETVYCMATKEVLYVKTTYTNKGRSCLFTMMWDKPTKPPKEFYPKKKKSNDVPRDSTKSAK